MDASSCCNTTGLANFTTVVVDFTPLLCPACHTSGREMDEDIPVIDLTPWLGKSSVEGGADDCQRLAEALHKFGVVIVRDPRVSESENDAFLDQMEAYYAQSDGVKDARPQVTSFTTRLAATTVSTALAATRHNAVGTKARCSPAVLYSHGVLHNEYFSTLRPL